MLTSPLTGLNHKIEPTYQFDIPEKNILNFPINGWMNGNNIVSHKKSVKIHGRNIVSTQLKTPKLIKSRKGQFSEIQGSIMQDVEQAQPH